MKSIAKRILLLLLVCSFALFAACGKDQGNQQTTDSNSQSTQSPEEPDNPSYPDTGEHIYYNGFCDYVLMIPAISTSYEGAAKDEFVDLFREATTYTIPVITDAQDIPEGKHIISLGNTSALRNSGVAVTRDELGYSGYKIVTVGKDVFISGDNSRICPGTLYGVYGFMNACFGYKQYSAECFRIDHVNKLTLKEWSITDVPDFDMRSLGYFDINSDATYANRMRLQQFNGPMTANEWVDNGHSMLQGLLNPGTYAAEHPDWYNINTYGYTLCLTNDEAMRAMADRVKTKLQENTVAEYFMLGQSDTNQSCTCANCQKRAAELGGSYSALLIEFINKISDIVTPWLAETQPGRHIEFYTFAYWWSLNPPGTDANGRRYVYARDNVGIMFTPLAMNYSYPITDVENSVFNSALNGWCEVTKLLTVYYYPISFHNYFLPFNQFGSLQTNMQHLKELGCKYYFTQGPHNETPGAALQDLFIYVQAQLLWDTTQSVEDLAAEFIRNYFADAAEPMQKYYDVTRAWYEMDLNGALRDAGQCYGDWGNENGYPKDFLDYLASCLDEGLTAIEKYKTTDPDLYDALYWRIEKERLTVMYVDLKNYTSYYNQEQVYEMAMHMKETCEHFSITSVWEGYPVSTFVSQYIN